MTGKEAAAAEGTKAVRPLHTYAILDAAKVPGLVEIWKPPGWNTAVSSTAMQCLNSGIRPLGLPG